MVDSLSYLMHTVDSLKIVAQTAQIVPYREIIASLFSIGLGVGGGVTVVGKIVYKYFNDRHCPMHDSLVEKITITCNNVDWLVKKQRGEI